jgi:hypothetical protein
LGEITSARSLYIRFHEKAKENRHPTRLAENVNLFALLNKPAPHLCGAGSESSRSYLDDLTWTILLGRSYLPVPVRFEICGLLLALSDACTVPVLVPIAVGVNTTLMVQVPPGATLDPQNVEETL